MAAQTPLRILLIEDDPEDAHIFNRHAAASTAYRIKVDHAADSKQARRLLAEGEYDLVFLDLHLGEWVSSLEILERFSSTGLEAPVIVLTGLGDEQSAVEMMKAGATDYLAKDAFSTEAMERSIRYALEAHRQAAERKRAQEALRQSEELFRLLVENAFDGINICEFDPVAGTRRLLFCNDRYVEMSGFTREQLNDARDLNQLIVQHHSQEERARHRDCIASGVPFTGTASWKRPDGKENIYEWSAASIKKGDKYHLVAIDRDVTEQRKLEEQLRRTSKLEAVGQLAGGVAHDFNNLLTAIIGYVDLDLLQIPEGSRLRANMEQIKAAAKRAADLTRQLLAFGRQQAAGTEVLDLNGVVQDVQNMLQRLIEETIEVSITLCDKPPMVKADRTQIEQVVMNLAVNARDAMPDGGVLSVRTGAVELDPAYARTHPGVQPGWHALLEVTDTGTGMDPQVQERIFDPFFTTKEVGKGTGLGLSTVYGIVQQHGGNIQCDSKVGRGTTFKVYLPLVEQEETTADQESDFTSFGACAETILVVEDEKEVRDLVIRALQTCGYSVLAASDGSEGLRLARKHDGNIDLLLTDIVMPKISGPELAQGVRWFRPNVKLMFMSGYPAGAAESVPGVPMLQKPFTLKCLAETVRQAFEGG